MINNNKYQWDIDCLLEGKSLEFLFNKWEKKEREILAFYPLFYKSLSNFKKWIKLNEESEILSNRLSNYVSNNLQEDLVNPKWLGYSQKISLISNEIHSAMSDYSNIILKKNKLILGYLKDNKINGYKKSFDLILKAKKHILEPVVQKALSKTSIINDGFDSIFSTLAESDIKFAPAKNSKGKMVKLDTVADVSKSLKDNDRVLRKNTWLNYNVAYKQFENTLVQTLYYNYLMLNTNAKVHNFKDYIAASAFSDEIDVSFILSMYTQVEGFKGINSLYKTKVNNLLKKQLKLSSLEPWDKSMDLSTKQITVSVKQTIKIVLEALKPLGDDYCSKIKKAFDEKWISWMPKKNKHHGAYSIGGINGLKKFFISMNFDSTMNSVETVTHELGHSMNSLYSSLSQKIYKDTRIFYAEIGSIATETLLILYLLNKYKDDKVLTNMYLKRLLDNFFACTTRQIQFSNFEYEANKLVNNGEPFTAQSLKKLFLEVTDKYEIIKDKKRLQKEPYSYYLTTILRVPHFYVGNFYVYKYAIGQICGLIVAYKIYNGDKKMLANYIKFLSSGSSLSPMQTISLLGIDLKTKQPYEEAINIVKELIKGFN